MYLQIHNSVIVFLIIIMASSTQSSSAQSLQTAAACTCNNNITELLKAHQVKASRLPRLEEIRTVIMHSSSYGQSILSTFSKKNEGYPSASFVEFASDAHGSPIIAVNRSATHSKDLKANPKCSLLIAKDLDDKADLVITLHGDAVTVSDEDREVLRAAYLSMHPDAVWVDSNDFQFMRIMPKIVEYQYGVGTALYDSGEFSIAEYKTAKVDPIYQFSKRISDHMNTDHAEDTKLIVQHAISYPVMFAKMICVDSLGFDVKAGFVVEGTLKLRIPFPRRAVDRKDVRVLVIEMLQAAKASLTADKDL